MLIGIGVVDFVADDFDELDGFDVDVDELHAAARRDTAHSTATSLTVLARRNTGTPPLTAGPEWDLAF